LITHVLNSYRLFDFFFFSSRRRHTRSKRDWSSDVCSSDLLGMAGCRFAAVLRWCAVRLWCTCSILARWHWNSLAVAAASRCWLGRGACCTHWHSRAYLLCLRRALGLLQGSYTHGFY